MSDRGPLFTVRDLVTGEGSPFSSVERLVALCLADHANKDGQAWPSRRTIEAWTGLGHSAVFDALQALCVGEHAIFDLEAGGARPGGRYRANVYTLKADAELSARRQPTATRQAAAQRTELSARRTRAVRQAASKGPRRDQEGSTSPASSAHGHGTSPLHGDQTSPLVTPANSPSRWVAEAAADFCGRFGGVANHGKVGRALKPLVSAHGWPEVRARWRRYLAATEARFVSPARFAETFGGWATDAPPTRPGVFLTRGERNLVAVRAFMGHRESAPPTTTPAGPLLAEVGSRP